MHYVSSDCRHPYRARLAALALTALLFVWATPLRAEASVTSDKFSKLAQECFIVGTTEALGYRPESVYAQAFVAERLMAYLSGDDPRLTQSAADALCKSDIIPNYIEGRKRAVKDMQAQQARKPDLAPLDEPIELNDKFAQFTANRFIAHIKTGHTELTRMAMDALPTDLRLGAAAKTFVAIASQTPDLYRFGDERYHAHTCFNPVLEKNRCHDEVDPPTRDRGTMVADSQKLYVQLMADLMKQVLRRAEQREYGRALFWLGAACHPMQDLAFHQGITVRQHAGLSYVVGNDPDGTDGPEGKRKVANAAEFCRIFVETALRRAGEHLSYLTSWKPKSGFNLRRLADDEFGSSSDMNTATLVSYWSLSRRYVFNADNLSELRREPNGLIIWDLDDVMARVRNAIGAE